MVGHFVQLAPGLEARLPLVRLADHGGPDPEEEKLLCPQLHEFCGRELAAPVVVGSDARHPISVKAVDADKRNVLIHLDIRVVGQRYDAFHLVLLSQADAFVFHFHIAFRRREKRPEPLCHQNLADIIRQEPEERVPHAGKDQCDDARMVGFEAFGIAVDLIAQLFGGFFHPDAVFLTDRDVVHHL